jgi:hypothetical protein
VSTAAVSLQLRSYAAALPRVVVTLPRPACMWLVDRDMRFAACVGPLVRFLPPATARTVAELLAGEPEAAQSIAAHRTALAGSQGRARLTAFGRRWQMAVTPMFAPAGDVIGAVGTAQLEPPNEDEVRAVYTAMADGRRLTLVAVADLPEHGLKEGDELVVVPGNHAERTRVRYVDPRAFGELLTGGLLALVAPFGAITPPSAGAPLVFPSAPEPRSAASPESPRSRFRRRLGRVPGPVALPSSVPALGAPGQNPLGLLQLVR